MPLHIAAWANLALSNGASAPVVSGNPVLSEAVPVSGASAQSAVFTTNPAPTGGYFVRLYADEACHVAIGVNPTATTAMGFKLAAGDKEWIGVPVGQRLAVIAGV